MVTILIIAAVIAAICYIPAVRTIARWIFFLPLGVLAGFIILYIDIPGLISSWLLSMISPTIALIFNTIDVFLSFFVTTLVAKVVCPSPKIGWCIAAGFCLLSSVFNLIISHAYTIIYVGHEGSGNSNPEVIWWHVVILVVASLVGAFASIAEDLDS